MTEVRLDPLAGDDRSVQIEVELSLNGSAIRVPVVLKHSALSTIAAAVVGQEAEPSPYLTVEEAALYLRCKRQRVDDLLSQRRIERVKDGTRTLIRRDELDAYLAAARVSR